MINKATLLGRVGKMDTKNMKNGGDMTVVSIATSHKYNDPKGEAKVITTWHNVNCFNKLSEIVQRYVKIGDLIYVDGQINNKKIEQGEKAGQWVYSLTAHDIKFIPTGNRKTEQQDIKTDCTSNMGNYEFDDPIPF